MRPNGKGRSDMARLLSAQATPGELVMPAFEQPAPQPMSPIGFVSGATLRPGTVITVPQVADDKTTAAVMETRGLDEPRQGHERIEHAGDGTAGQERQRAGGVPAVSHAHRGARPTLRLAHHVDHVDGADVVHA